MTYLLDHNVVQYFFHAGRERELMDAAARCPLAVAGEVRAEMMNDPKNGARARKWLAAGPIAVLEIEVGSDVDDTFQALKPLVSAQPKGERASIALATHDASLTFVANDRNAMWMALNELHAPGERLVGQPVFLRRLHDAAAVEPAAIDDVMHHWQGRRPSWWATWRASLERAATP